MLEFLPLPPDIPHNRVKVATVRAGKRFFQPNQAQAVGGFMDGRAAATGEPKSPGQRQATRPDFRYSQYEHLQRDQIEHHSQRDAGTDCHAFINEPSWLSLRKKLRKVSICAEESAGVTSSRIIFCDGVNPVTGSGSPI